MCVRYWNYLQAKDGKAAYVSVLTLCKFPLICLLLGCLLLKRDRRIEWREREKKGGEMRSAQAKGYDGTLEMPKNQVRVNRSHFMV